jgi:arylsulfatase A-like enzyme
LIVAYSALIEDLQSRGLLDETLIVVMGEFGRSPTINKSGGRDHWGNVFSVAHGRCRCIARRSDHRRERQDRRLFPADRPVRPPDLAATMFHLLGIQPESRIP